MFTEDFSAFFDTSTGFAQVASLGGVAVAGILDLLPGQAFDVMAGTTPQFVIQSSSVPADPRGLSLIVGSSTFTVRDWTNDGTGVSTLILEAV